MFLLKKIFQLRDHVSPDQEKPFLEHLEDLRAVLFRVVITLIVVGVLLWLVNNYIPMDGKIKKILNVVVVICVIVWLLYAFGIISHSGDIRVPQLH